MKVCKNLKSAMQRWRVTFPTDDIGDPPAVFKMYSCRQNTGFIAVFIQIVYACMY